MCDVTYIPLLLSTIGTYAKYEADKDSAAKQQQLINEGLEKDQAATRRAYEQIQETAQDEKQQRHTEYLVDKARIMAIQAESGLSGANYDKAVQKTEDAANTDVATIERNTQRRLDNTESQASAKAHQAKVQASGIRQPSAMQAGLQIAGYGVDAYNQYANPKPKAR